jgi:hypothetical protein
MELVSGKSGLTRRSRRGGLADPAAPPPALGLVDMLGHHDRQSRVHVHDRPPDSTIMTRSLIADIVVPVFLLLCAPAVFGRRGAAQQAASK